MQPKLEKASTLLALLANPSRLHILCTISEGEKSVLSLAVEIGMSQPGVSQHLKKLKTEGLVATRREAQTIYYRLAGREAKAILATLYDLYCSDDTGSNVAR